MLRWLTAGESHGQQLTAILEGLPAGVEVLSAQREDLVALAQSAIENWRRHDDARRFTGPAARGDTEVMQRHLDALADDPQLARIYELVAAHILATQK